MRRTIPPVLDTIAVVALALWLGGLAACWLVLSPAVRALPAESAATAQLLFVETLRRLSTHIEVSGLVLAALQWVMRRRYQRDRTLFIADGVRMLVLFIALFCAEYGRYVLIPTLLKTQAPAAYTVLSGLAVAQAVLLIGYAATTARLQMPRMAASVPIRTNQSSNPPPTPAKRRPKR